MQILTASPFGVPLWPSLAGKWIGGFCFLIVSFSGTLAGAQPLFGNFNEAGNEAFQFKVMAITDPERIQPGGRFTLHVQIELTEGWHIYSMNARAGGEESLATRIRLDSDAFLPQGPWEEPVPSIILDGALDRVVKTHNKTVGFHRLHQVPETFAPGAQRIGGSIVFRACNNKVCSLPRELPFTAWVQVTGGDG